MSSLRAIHRARPDVPPATTEAREDARRRLLAAIEHDAASTPDTGDATALVDAAVTELPTRSNGHGRHGTPRSDNGAPPSAHAVARLPGVSAPGTPWVRGTRWAAGIAASIALVLGVVSYLPFLAETDDALDVVAAPDPASGDAMPQAADEHAPGLPAPPPRAPFGTYDTFTESVTNWDDDGGFGTVTAPEQPGPWPIVILLFHPDVAEEPDATFPAAHLDGMLPVAELLASTGLQVATMPWTEVPEPQGAELDTLSRNIACFVANARTWGRKQNGDPSRVTVLAQGASAYFAIDAVVRDVDRRTGCNGWNEARPDLVISLAGDVDLTSTPWLDGAFAASPDSVAGTELDARATENTHIPFLFLDRAAGGPWDSPGSADDRRVADALAARGYTANVLEVDGLGVGAWSPTHPATRQALERVVDAAHAVRR